MSRPLRQSLVLQPLDMIRFHPKQLLLKCIKLDNCSFRSRPAKKVTEVLSTREAHKNTGKINRFTMSSTVLTFPTKRCIPKAQGRFGRIKNGDNHDGWEAEVLQNVEYNAKHEMASS